MHYLVTWQESDSNDVTVYDTVLEAPDRETAINRLADAMEAMLKENGQEFTPDGNELGYWFECGDDCPEECDGHGGTYMRDVEAFETEEAARAAMAPYHIEWAIPVVDAKEGSES